MRIGGGVSVRRIVGIGLLMVVAAGCVGSGPSATASELALASPSPSLAAASPSDIASDTASPSAASSATAVPRMLDGWSLGPVTDCTSSCVGEIQSLATARLDQLVPSHPAVATVQAYREGLYRRTDGSVTRVLRTTVVTIFVFTLAGGGRRAVGVVCGVGCTVAESAPLQVEIDEAP